MNRRTSTETSQTPAPHPLLAASLSCMDLQLEAELARYRRQRSDREEDAPVGQSPTSAHPSARREGTPLKLALPILSVTDAATDIAAPIIPPELQTEQPQPVEAVAPEKMEMGLVPQPSEAQTEPLGEPAPDDYLESSERLLRNLNRKNAQPETTPSPNLADRLLTPLGISSMLLLLLAGTMLGAALIDPAIVSRLGVDRWFKSKTATVADRPETASPQESTPPSSAANQPKLDTDEFVELELDNLSTIEPSTPSVAPTTPTSPAGAAAPQTGSAVILPEGIPGSPSNLTRALIPPTVPPSGSQTQSAPDAKPPTTRPAEPSNAPPAPEPPPGDRFYYVTADYSSPTSLQQAASVVPDAYLRNFAGGTRIQMGAFLRESDAKRLVKQLQEQGLSASVYHR